MILPLQKGVLYGPIHSRRLGTSLGINLMPCGYKLCSFNCVYCHYGSTDILSLDMHNHLNALPHTDSVLGEIEHAMKSSLKFGYLTFSGNGEPTLHPQFHEIVTGVVALRNRYRPAVRIALLSNASGITREEVRMSVAKIDLPVFKLDTGSEKKFEQINRPAERVNFEEIVDVLTNVKEIYLQTVFMLGNPSNVSAQDLNSYFEKVVSIKPVEVQVYSLDRPVPNENIKRVLPTQLEKIATVGSKKTGVNMRAFYIEENSRLRT